MPSAAIRPSSGDALERGAARRALREAALRAEGGAGALLVIEGDPGLGKTRMLNMAAEEADERGHVVLRARGLELERSFAFGMALQLFEPYLATAGARERRRALGGGAAGAEPLLAAADGIPAEGEAPFRTLHALFWLTANIAERQPVAVLVDDAHAADAPSLRMLLHLAQRIERLPIVIAIAANPRASAGNDPLIALMTHPLAERLPLAALSAAATGALTRRALPGAGDALGAAVAQATDGNPLFVRELLAELAAAGTSSTADLPAHVAAVGPASIARHVAARIERCSPHATALARAIAVLGEGTPLSRAAAIARVEPSAARAAADALTAAGILRPVEDLGFVHPIVRQALYCAIPAAERAQIHLEAARRLRVEPECLPHAASHLLRTMPADEGWIAELLHEHARVELERGAPQRAATLLRRALEEPPAEAHRAGVLIDLARAEALAGSPDAIERLQAAVALLDDPRERARALCRLGRALHSAGRNSEAGQTFDEGLRLLDGDDPGLEEELVAAHIAAARFDLRTREVVLRRFGTVIDRASEAATGPQRELLAHRATEMSLRADVPCQQVLETLRRAFADGQLLRDVGSDNVAYVSACLTMVFCDALEELEHETTTGLEDARRRGSVAGLAAMSSLRGFARYLRGDVSQAILDLHSGLERSFAMPVARPLAYAGLIFCHVDRNELDEAEAVLARAAEERLEHLSTFGYVLQAQSRYAVHRGDPARALVDALEVGRRQASASAPSPAANSWRTDAAIAALKLGHVAQAREITQEGLELARTFGAPCALGVALRGAGLAVGGAEGFELLEEAVRVLERSPARVEHARALVALGAARRRAGQQAAAREILREALDLSFRCGVTWLSTLARAELVAAGARPRRFAQRGSEALTASELRIAELAAQGMTNREVAQTVFISTKTVEFHLRNAYRKLGISSRGELVAALGSEEPLDEPQARP